MRDDQGDDSSFALYSIYMHKIKTAQSGKFAHVQAGVCVVVSQKLLNNIK